MRAAAFILTLFSAWMGATLAVTGQERPEGRHPAVEIPPLYLRYRFTAGGREREGTIPLEIPPMKAATLDRYIPLPAPIPSLKVVEYLPLASLEQRLVPEPDGHPGVAITIKGTKLSYERCLLANDPDRDRMISLIASWRIAALPAKERESTFRKFREGLHGEPTLVVSGPESGTTYTLPARKGEEKTIEPLHCTVRVLDFFPHYSSDQTTGSPVNLSDKRRNPAAHIELARDGDLEERWVFSLFPDFKSGKGETLPLRVRLECPLDLDHPIPDFVIAVDPGGGGEIWMRYEGESNRRPIRTGEALEIPGSRYRFTVDRLLAEARLEESFHPAADRREAVTVLAVELLERGKAQGKRIWLPMGKRRILHTAGGALMLEFGSGKPAKARGEGMPPHGGTGKTSFEKQR